VVILDTADNLSLELLDTAAIVELVDIAVIVASAAIVEEADILATAV
jgi:hypothetical protein